MPKNGVLPPVYAGTCPPPPFPDHPAEEASQPVGGALSFFPTPTAKLTDVAYIQIKVLHATFKVT